MAAEDKARKMIARQKQALADFRQAILERPAIT